MGSLSPGDRLLHFRIVDHLGQGGMGEVYLAEDQKLGRKVALKVLSARSTATENARARLIQEARSASALNHPNIVTVHSIEENDGIVFIVMEYVQGETLSSRLQREMLSLSELVEIHKQTAEGLSAAHERGVIHRDIKPSNILIASGKRVKILDFGLAKLTATDPDDLPTGYEELTKAGTILGTVSYMSPEQVRGEPLDPLSDIFSFGCVLYESATRRLPFRGPDPTAVMYQITTAPVIPPSSLRGDLPVRFDAIVIKTLAKEKHHRYSSAREIMEDLNALIYPDTIVVSTSSTPALLLKKEGEFVGREEELTRLHNDFQITYSGAGQTVFITGEPGIGKTSLAEEFLRTAAASYAGCIVVRGRCVEHFGTGEAYLPFLDAIGTLLNSPYKEKLAQILRVYAPTWCSQFPGAFSSTGQLETSQKEAAGASKERMLREISDALAEFSAGSPLILFFEDLHWADPSTADLLRYFCRRIQDRRIFVLATFREEDLESGNPAMKACRLDLNAHSISEEIHMDSFTREQVQQYLDQHYSPNRFEKQFTEMIFRKTEGHPLFLTSLTQFLVAQKVMENPDGVWSVRPEFSDTDFQMPENVRSMIQRKMEALPDEDRRMLQYASIEGEEFTSLVLSELLNEDEIDLEERLNKVERAHRMIRKTEEEDWPDGSLVTKYRFVHALYQNAFYSDIVTKRRVQLHRLAGDSLLKHFAHKAPAIANKLGLHYQRGRDYEKAIRYLSLAADHAKSLHANQEAAHLYGEALLQMRELITKDPVTWNPQAALLHEKRGDALSMLGKQLEAKDELEQALDLLVSDDSLNRARLHRKIAKAVETVRLFSEALEHYEKGESLLKPGLDEQSIEWQREFLQINLDQTWLYYTQNLTDGMQAMIRKVEPLIEKIGTPPQKLMFYHSYTLLNNRLDRYRISEQTMALIERAEQIAMESGVASSIATSNFVAGFTNLWRGNFDRSELYLKECLAQVLRIGDAVLQSRCLTYLAVLYRLRNNQEETRTYAVQALNLAQAINMQEYVAAAKANLGWFEWRIKNYGVCKDLCAEAIRIWQNLPVISPFQELAFWPLIGIALRESRIVEAREYAAGILDPSQRKLDPELEQLLQTAIRSDDATAHRLLIEAAKIAETAAYL